MTLEAISGLSMKFASDILSGKSPKEMCFTVCYPLHIYLNALGVNNSVAGGWYKVSEKSQPSHFWLALSDYADCIVDPTIQQFEPDSSMVYVGPKPDTHLLIRMALSGKSNCKFPNNETGIALYRIAEGSGVDMIKIEKEQKDKANARGQRVKYPIKDLQKRRRKLKQ